MAWTNRGTWDAARNPDIDILLPGLERGEGRSQDRLKLSGGTKDKKLYDERVKMLKDLHAFGQLEPLRALYDEQVDLATLGRVYGEKGRAGVSTLTFSSKKAAGLLGLVREYIATLQKRVNQMRDPILQTRKQWGLDTKLQEIERFLDYVGRDEATLDDLTVEQINDFLDDLTQLPRGRNNHGGGRPMAGATRNRYRAALQGFCTWLVQKKYITTSPYLVRGAVTLFDEKEGRKRLPELEPEEFTAYLEAVREIGGEEMMLVQWAEIETGADVGEFHEADGLRVRHCRFGAITRLRFIRTKTMSRGAQEREVPVTADFADALKGYIESRGLGLDDVVFGHLDNDTAWKIHKKAMKQIGRKDVTRKDLRHVAAIRWRRMGEDLQEIRQRLGHATIEQTSVYTDYRPSDHYDLPKLTKLAELYKAPERRRLKLA